MLYNISMKEYIWLFVVIFIFHDMEEIVGMKLFFEKNKELLQKKASFLAKRYGSYTTAGFSLGVYEELVFFMLISGLAFWTDVHFFKFMWLGAFIGVAAHFVVHIVSCIVLRKYIPSLITSIICLPVSVCIILKAFMLMCWFSPLTFSLIQAIAAIALSLVLCMLNFGVAHKLIAWFSNKSADLCGGFHTPTLGPK